MCGYVIYVTCVWGGRWGCAYVCICVCMCVCVCVYMCDVHFGFWLCFCSDDHITIPKITNHITSQRQQQQVVMVLHNNNPVHMLATFAPQEVHMNDLRVLFFPSFFVLFCSHIIYNDFIIIIILVVFCILLYISTSTTIPSSPCSALITHRITLRISKETSSHHYRTNDVPVL